LRRASAAFEEDRPLFLMEFFMTRSRLRGDSPLATS
jgi:hypothetical protein